MIKKKELLFGKKRKEKEEDIWTMSQQQGVGSAAGTPVVMSHDPSAGPGWTGLTIKEILEKVDLFNVTIEKDQDNIKTEKVLVNSSGSSNHSASISNNGAILSNTLPKPAFKVSQALMSEDCRPFMGIGGVPLGFWYNNHPHK